MRYSRGIRQLAALGVAIAVSGIGCASASAAWTVKSTTPPAGAKESKFEGISCEPTGAGYPALTAITGCVAVGRHVASGVTSALGEELSGTTWTQITLPSITGATASTLDRVSCLEGPLCYAAGYYVSGGKNVMLVERSF